MKYFFDTEFIENGETIILISIGIVAEDGREYFAISNEFNPEDAGEWVEKNVLCHLPAMGSKIDLKGEGDHPITVNAWRSREQIKEDILEFVGGDSNPAFWAYFADYDWIIMCQLFGTLMALPEHFPKYCCDVKQLADDLKMYPIPISDATPLHDALADARWAKSAWEFLSMHGKCKALKFVKELRPEVGNFALAMELILRSNDHKDSFHQLPTSLLRVNLLEQVTSLSQALSVRDLPRIQKQAIDVANFAMMIFTNIESVKYHEQPSEAENKFVSNQM